MTNGENYLELKVKRYLFSDTEEFLRIRMLQNQAVQKVRNKYLQDDANGKYRVPGKDNTSILVRDLNDEAFDAETCGDLNDIMARYEVIKQETYDVLHRNAINGIIGGAKNYLEKIIKM